MRCGEMINNYKMDIISPKTHLLVVSTDENPVVEDNRVLLQTIKGKHNLHIPTMFYPKLLNVY